MREFQGSSEEDSRKFKSCLEVSMVFLEISRMCKKFLVWKFNGCVESISRVFQETFEGVSGLFLMVFEASSKGVCQTSY